MRLSPDWGPGVTGDPFKIRIRLLMPEVSPNDGKTADRRLVKSKNACAARVVVLQIGPSAV
jgi:hypothetical protein